MLGKEQHPSSFSSTMLAWRGGWLLQNPGSWDHGKNVEREVIVKWSCRTEAWGSRTQTLLSLIIPRCLDFLAWAFWCYFYPSFIGKQGAELVPLYMILGLCGTKGSGTPLRSWWKSQAFFLKKCKSTQTLQRTLHRPQLMTAMGLPKMAPTSPKAFLPNPLVIFWVRYHYANFVD